MPKLTKKPYIPRKELNLTCAACGQLKNETQFYTSYNPIHTTNRIPYCKDCLKNMISDDKGNVTLEKLQSTLQLIDRPFIFDLWKISLEDKMNTFGCYMKNLSLKQNRELTWKDSVFKPQLNNELNYDNTLNTNHNISTRQSDFIVNDEIMEKWGLGYTIEEYTAFEKNGVN